VFYYYGRKKKIAGLYPDPQHQILVEPFAGSAAYSLHGYRWKNQVILVEKDPQIAALWRWLIEEATPESILSLPDPVEGQKTDELLHILCMSSKRWFTYRNATPTPFMDKAWKANKAYMAANLYKVKHWKIIEGDYTAAPDIEATWFIDPPYDGDAGTGYLFGSDKISYVALADWCLNRKGAVAVCEGAGARWLPFQPLCQVSAIAGKKHDEVLYLQGWRRDNPIEELFG